MNVLTIPNDPNLIGVSVFVQGAWDATFQRTATFSPLDELRIQ